MSESDKEIRIMGWEITRILVQFFIGFIVIITVPIWGLPFLCYIFGKIITEDY
jgi:hypothetical protein